MSELLKPYWLPIIKYAGIVFGLVLVYFKGRVDNNSATLRKEGMDNLKRVQESAKIENYVASAKPDKLEQLRKQFNRD